MISNTDNLTLGYSKGEMCNRDGCKGVVDEYEKDGCCSCHIDPPCSYCVEPNAFCNTCGWNAKGEQQAYDRLQLENYKNNEHYYKQEYIKHKESSDLFYKKYRGEIPADKLEIRTKSHTHFSMIKVGVFPKGSETYASLLPKVVGSFGGRFVSVVDENSYNFEYISYTD